MSKLRLDQYLVDSGLAETKSKAQQLIAGGYVFVSGLQAKKPAQPVASDAEIDVRGQEHPWVSRGGMKLAHAIEHFKLSVAGEIVIDVGASTGGFTDVLLQHGAAKIYAVDVGTDQLHPKLRGDTRVISLEQTNAKDLTVAEIPEPVDLIVCDASFISLAKVLPVPLSFTKDVAELVTLIKPQFEVGKERLAKGGVVKDEALHEEVCNQVRDWMNAQAHWQVQSIVESPITGPKGNKEFLLYAIKGGK